MLYLIIILDNVLTVTSMIFILTFNVIDYIEFKNVLVRQVSYFFF